MGAATVGDTRTASLRLRAMIQRWIANHGAERVRSLPAEFCKKSFVLGQSSEEGFGNNMYKRSASECDRSGRATPRKCRSERSEITYGLPTRPSRCARSASSGRFTDARRPTIENRNPRTLHSARHAAFATIEPLSPRPCSNSRVPPAQEPSSYS